MQSSFVSPSFFVAKSYCYKNICLIFQIIISMPKVNLKIEDFYSISISLPLPLYSLFSIFFLCILSSLTISFPSLSRAEAELCLSTKRPFFKLDFFPIFFAWLPYSKKWFIVNLHRNLMIIFLAEDERLFCQLQVVGFWNRPTGSFFKVCLHPGGHLINYWAPVLRKCTVHQCISYMNIIYSHCKRKGRF